MLVSVKSHSPLTGGQFPKTAVLLETCNLQISEVKGSPQLEMIFHSQKVIMGYDVTRHALHFTDMHTIWHKMPQPVQV